MVVTYDAEPVTITVPGILFRISHLYRDDMTKLEVYEATRGTWKIKPDRHKPSPIFAFAVYKGIVREVYRIKSWDPAGTTPYQTRSDIGIPDRQEFVGEVAEPDLRNKYINKSVAHYFKTGAQNPCTYVNC